MCLMGLELMLKLELSSSNVYVAEVTMFLGVAFALRGALGKNLEASMALRAGEMGILCEITLNSSCKGREAAPTSRNCLRL